MLSVGACLCLWWPETALAPLLSSWRLREGVQVICVLSVLLGSPRELGVCICLFAASGKAVTGTWCVCFFVIVQVGDRHLHSKRPETFVVPLLVFLLLLLSSCFISEYLIINLNFLFSPFTFPKIPPKSVNCKQGN